MTYGAPALYFAQSVPAHAEVLAGAMRNVPLGPRRRVLEQASRGVEFTRIKQTHGPLKTR
jgi:hypothetical protein